MANRFSRAAFLPAASAAAAAALAAGFVHPLPAAAAEDYASWANVTDLTMNTSATGAGVAITVTGFPMLVRLTAANFDFSQARADGRDIRFAKRDGKPLPYEIERWDAARKAAEVWVKVDSIKGNDASQAIRMYWGNAGAPDSSNPSAVFGAGNGYVAAWHLTGAGTAARPNAVSGGNPAAAVNYDGDENAAGVIAGADSLDGAAAGDYLDVGDGYADFTGGLTYTVWAFPTAVKQWAHVLDLGNGEGIDNIILNRNDTTTALGFHDWAGTASSQVTTANGQWTLNQWQMFGVTVSGRNVKLYRNGTQILSDSLPFPIANVARTMCFLGRSNWSRDQYYQGKLDEPELSNRTHSADWMKLLYLNQKPGQALPVVVRSTACAWKFGATGDTSVPEGGSFVLHAQVDCASSFAWSVVSGPAARILDPEQKDLPISVPRVQGDTDLVFRLTAVYSDSTRVRDVRLRVREAIPDPAFTLPALAGWSGKEPLAYRPLIANLAAIRATRDSVLHWSWSFTGPAVDTGWLADGVLLKNADEGELGIKLCLDNGGPTICKNGELTVSATSGVLAPPASVPARKRPGRDALGRAPGMRAASPAFLRP
jgi:hypothetical protein